MSVRSVLTPLAAAVLILTLSAARCGSIGNTSITTTTDSKVSTTSTTSTTSTGDDSTGGKVITASTTTTASTGGDSTGGDSGGEVRWWISADTVDCYGMVPRTCLQVATTPGGKYTRRPFDYEIRGFVHEAGTSYVIDVKITEIEDPPADGSSLRYDLVRIVEPRN